MNKEKIKEYRGVRNLVAAEVTKDEADEITFGEVFYIAGTSELSKEVESSSESHYYDNTPAIVIDSTGADTITATVSAIRLEVVARLTGQHYDNETGTLVEGERTSKYFAIGYITEDTDGEEVFVWRLKTKCSIPSSTHSTKDDGTDANGQELTFTGINTTHVFKSTGKTAKSVNLEMAKKKTSFTEADFFATPQTPDTIAEKKGTVTIDKK